MFSFFSDVLHPGTAKEGAIKFGDNGQDLTHHCDTKLELNIFSKFGGKKNAGIYFSNHQRPSTIYTAVRAKLE